MSVPITGPVFAAITEELQYQDEQWGTRVPDAYSGGTAFDRSLDEYTLYIKRYADKLAAGNCRTAADFQEKVHILRKIAALTVGAMAEHGPLTREQENNSLQVAA